MCMKGCEEKGEFEVKGRGWDGHRDAKRAGPIGSSRQLGVNL